MPKHTEMRGGLGCSDGKQGFISGKWSGAQSPNQRQSRAGHQDLMEFCHNKNRFYSSEYKTELKRFLNYYNSFRSHKGINGLIPEEKLIEYFYPEIPKNCKQ
jgi:transposase InsO family protein